MTPSELKFKVESAGRDSHFFDRKTMRFFGDTMRNYGVRAKPVTVQTSTGPIEAWELYRKQPVKHGVKSSAFFHVETSARVFPSKG